MDDIKEGDPIRCKGGDGHMWRLTHLYTGDVVRVGDFVTTVRGKEVKIVGGRPPKHWGSTGHVWTETNNEFYPGVFNLAWVRESE